jgi:thiosulfate/3-mercaptopyruvate sulfurtransferase
MKKQGLLFILILALIMPVQYIFAQDVISASELAKISKKPDVIVVSVRSTADYKKVHITGAVHVDMKELYTNQPVESMLKPATDVAKVLGSKGISESKQIIVYDEGTGKSAGRMYWILDYMGASNVKILNGGMKGWRAARKPVTKNPTNVKAATFSPNVDKSKWAGIAEVKKAVDNGSFVLVDARSVAEFKGTDQTDIRKGHIPGAVNIEFSQVLKADGTLKPAAELKSLFEKAGVTKDKTVIVYCKSSVRAGMIYFALRSGLGYANVKIFDGAFLEWQADASNKVET